VHGCTRKLLRNIDRNNKADVDFQHTIAYSLSMKKKTKPKKRLNVLQDLTTVELKVDEVLEISNKIWEEMRTQTVMISQIATKEEIMSLLNLKNDPERVKRVLREKLNVEV
jgi:hypothetical protein